MYEHFKDKIIFLKISVDSDSDQRALFTSQHALWTLERRIHTVPGVAGSSEASPGTDKNPEL